jgi:gliding motility-associated-like protein
MRLPITVFLFFSMLAIGQSQVIDGLRAYYTFEFCEGPIIEDTIGGNNGIINNAPNNLDCRCGVEGSALRFDGIDDFIVFDGVFQEIFNTRDFSVSFYLKPDLAIGNQVILSKRENCNPDRSFSITYNSNNRQLRVVLRENNSKQSILTTQLSEGGCWFHIALVRDGNTAKLFIDGEEAAENRQSARVDITNAGKFLVSEASAQPCTGNEVPFAGTLDELKIYKRALLDEEVRALYSAPETILNRDTSIFIGDAVDIQTIVSCTDLYSWFPIDGVSDPNAAEPIISPEETTTYRITFTQGNECIAIDSIEITVIDPSKLDCEKVFLPKAFTPNGDGLNDTYGISNFYVIEELLDFEILDRWGNRVFYTVEARDTWDGTFLGKEVNPGVFLYRIRYICNNEEKTLVGSLTVIR